MIAMSCRTTAYSGPGPRFSSRHPGQGHRCAAPSADAERWVDKELNHGVFESERKD